MLTSGLIFLLQPFVPISFFFCTVLTAEQVKFFYYGVGKSARWHQSGSLTIHSLALLPHVL